MRPMAFLLLAVTILSLFGLTPFPAHEVAEMKPAELLCLKSAEGGVLAETEEGVSAWGKTMDEALDVLRRAAPGELFLATVENLVLTEVAVKAEALTARGIRPGTAVYTAPGVEDPKSLNAYLKAHSGGVTLGMLQEDPAQSLPALTAGQSGLYLEGSPL